MSTYQKCGPFILTDKVQELPYGSLMRAVKSQGYAFLEHLQVLLPNNQAREAGFEGALEQNRDWFDSFDGIKRVDSLRVFVADETPKIWMAHLRGRSLASILAKNEEDQLLRLEHVLTLAQGLAFILGNLNKAGLAHGALNLDGTWYDIDGNIRILDAPLGKVLLETGLQDLALGPLAEHKIYRNLDFQNDQESFGLILYHLIKGSWPNRADLVADVMGLTMTQQEDWSDQEEVVLPQPVKEVILRSIQGSYPDGESFVQDVNAAYNHPDVETFNATTFGAAFLLSSLFRTEMPGEAEAIELEKSHEFMEAVGEPKVIEKEKIIFQEDLRKKRRTIAIAVALTLLGLIGGSTALLHAKRNRENQERIKKDTEGLISQYKTEIETFREEEKAWEYKFSHAQTQEEKNALLVAFQERKKEHEAKLAAIKANLDALQQQQRSIGGEAKKINLASIPEQSGPGLTQATPQVANPSGGPGAAKAAAPQSEPTPAVVAKDRPKINPESIPFSPSAKVPMGQEAPPAVTPEPVFLSGPTKVEVLKVQGTTRKDDIAPPAVSVKDQNTANQFRRLVMPQLDQAALRDFVGQLVRVRILVDQFGNAKSANIEECPASLAADFKAAALKTQFNPRMENGRAKQEWITLSYRVTGTGITFNGTK